MNKYIAAVVHYCSTLQSIYLRWIKLIFQQERSASSYKFSVPNPLIRWVSYSPMTNFEQQRKRFRFLRLSLYKAADGCVPPAELCFFFQTIQNRPEKGSLLLLFFLLPPLKKERSPIQVQTQTQLKKKKK